MVVFNSKCSVVFKNLFYIIYSLKQRSCYYLIKIYICKYGYEPIEKQKHSILYEFLNDVTMIMQRAYHLSFGLLIISVILTALNDLSFSDVNIGNRQQC